MEKTYDPYEIAELLVAFIKKTLKELTQRIRETLNFGMEDDNFEEETT